MSDGLTRVCPISKFRFAVNSLYDECKMRNSVLSSLIFSLFCIIHVQMSVTHAVILMRSSHQRRYQCSQTCASPVVFMEAERSFSVLRLLTFIYSSVPQSLLQSLLCLFLHLLSLRCPLLRCILPEQLETKCKVCVKHLKHYKDN